VQVPVPPCQLLNQGIFLRENGIAKIEMNLIRNLNRVSKAKASCPSVCNVEVGLSWSYYRLELLENNFTRLISD